MNTTVTLETLPDFLAKISYLMKVDGQVICDIKNPVNDDNTPVDIRRSEITNPREAVRQEMKQHPDRFSSLITK